MNSKTDSMLSCELQVELSTNPHYSSSDSYQHSQVQKSGERFFSNEGINFSPFNLDEDSTFYETILNAHKISLNFKTQNTNPPFTKFFVLFKGEELFEIDDQPDSEKIFFSFLKKCTHGLTKVVFAKVDRKNYCLGSQFCWLIVGEGEEKVGKYNRPVFCCGSNNKIFNVFDLSGYFPSYGIHKRPPSSCFEKSLEFNVKGTLKEGNGTIIISRNTNSLTGSAAEIEFPIDSNLRERLIIIHLTYCSLIKAHKNKSSLCRFFERLGIY